MPTCQQVDKGLKRGWQIFDRPHLPRFPFLLFRLLPVRKYGCRFENETERGLKRVADDAGDDQEQGDEPCLETE